MAQGLPRGDQSGAWWGSNLARLLLSAIVVQLLYWTLFVPNFVNYRSAERPDFLEIQNVEEAQIASPDAAGLSSAIYRPYNPGLRVYERGYHATRVTFELEQVPETGLALLDNSAGDHIRFYVNGALLSAAGEARLPKPTYHALQKRIVPISAGLLVAGENSIESAITFDMSREADTPPPLLAEFDAVEAAFSWTDFLFNDWRNITIGIGFVLALMLGAVALRANERAIPFWLFLLTLSWSTHTLFYRWVNFPLAGNERVIFYSVNFIFMSACWPAFVDAWTRNSIQYFRPAMMGLFAVGAAFVVFWLGIERATDGFSKTEAMLDLLGLVLVGLTIARLIWHFATKPEESRYLEGAALILLASLIGFFLYNTLIHDRNVGHLPATQPLLLLAIAIGFFARNFRLFRSAAEINQLLQGKLDQREAELADVHLREKLWVREQAFSEERQRIMRDMHDGLGSQLMGMLLAAKRGKAEPEKVAEGLQQVVDELRLMIDSMDSVGESLGSALASFRNRLQPRVEDAGFAFRWNNRLGEDLPSYPPRTALQLFRIMQEAVANALKHSGGSQITITLSKTHVEGEWLEVSVADDGKGIAGPRLGGHGLENMIARATKEMGSVTFGSPEDGQGGQVLILFPIEATNG